MLVIAVLAALVLVPPAVASAQPTNPLCADGKYRVQHPLICDTGQGLPGISSGNTGGDGGGGLLGALGRALGGIL